MENLNFKPKTWKCPKCDRTLSSSVKFCPICSGASDQDKNVSEKLDVMRKGKLGIKPKHFGKIRP
jgi:RNA polymerase subunit RPABC4/transcription elongation factor Spt4